MTTFIHGDRVSLHGAGDHVSLHVDNVNLRGDHVNLRGDRVNLRGDRLNLRGDHVSLRATIRNFELRRAVRPAFHCLQLQKICSVPGVKFKPDNTGVISVKTAR